MRVAVDIGGTFTDVTVFDEASGRVYLGKALSTPHDLVEGILTAIDRSGVSPADARTIVHGSTIVINAIIERRGARTALVTTRGFRDTYEIGRINRPESFNLFFRKHRPLIPRELVFEVPERMLADGTEERPLDEHAARQTAARLKQLGVESVAILFLHAYRTPDHEERMRAILCETNPDWFVTASHELSREYREYERTSTVAANAYVGPLASRYLANLEDRTRAEGFTGDLLIMQSSGGLTDIATARRQCVQMLESGPAGGVVGTVAVCQALGFDDAISFDMGGTTAKSTVVRQRRPEESPDYFVGGYNEGLAIRIPVLDIREVGTGGGSIARVDEGGALHVGPESAGAQPGPACYGRGGVEPTVTDADVALGWIAPDRFTAGDLSLDSEAASRAIHARVAAPLGLSFERAAAGILAIALASMANSVRAVTTQRGLDPRDFLLMTYGGAGPPHGVAVARELSIGRVVVPNAPAHFSAFGMMLADHRRDSVRTCFLRLSDLRLTDLEALYADMEAQGQAALVASGVPPQQVSFTRAADMRYVGQEHAVTVPVAARLADREADREALKATFDAAHQQRYSHSAPEEPVEIVSLRVSAVGPVSRPTLPRLPEGGPEPPADARRGTRRILFQFDGAERELCPVFDRLALEAGNVIVGPAAIEEPGSTTLLWPGDRLTVHPTGVLVVEVA